MNFLIDFFKKRVGKTSKLDYPDWRPIETAPKDGDEILIGCASGDMGVAYWRDDGHMTGWTCGWGTIFRNPDRWMPLPPIGIRQPYQRPAPIPQMCPHCGQAVWVDVDGNLTLSDRGDYL